MPVALTVAMSTPLALAVAIVGGSVHGIAALILETVF
jgi:hypothetical protein